VSRSLDSQEEKSALEPGQARQAVEARLALSQMMRTGRSWSGRERNCAFLNTGNGRFANISALSGLDPPDDGRAIGVVDWDGDGDEDLWLSNRNGPRLRFMRNNARDSAQTHFLSLGLRGTAATTPRDAIGARVEVLTPNSISPRARRTKTLHAGEGFLSQSSKWLHFGLGPETEVESVRVHWPGSEPERFTDIRLDHRQILEQGTGQSRDSRSEPERQVDLIPSQPQPPALSEAARIPLVMLLEMPSVGWTSFDDEARAIDFGKGKAIWLNLWASWCAPCLAELGEITRREADLRAAGVEVVALAVDGLGDDRSSPARAEEIIDDRDFPFTAGRATASTVRLLQNLHGWLTPLHLPLPVPTSFLIDANGRLAVIYKGRVEVDQVLADLHHARGTRRERFERSAPFPGIALASPRVESVHAREESKVRLQIAGVLSQVGRLADAERQYQDLLQRDPDFIEARVRLAALQLTLGNPEQAAATYELALALDPDRTQARFDLGRALELAGQLERAEQTYLSVEDSAPSHTGISIALGRLHFARGDTLRARELFERELARNPGSPEAHHNLARLAMDRGHHDQARDHLLAALRSDSNDAEAHNTLGAVYLHLDQLPEAATHLERAIELRGDLIEARFNRVLLLERQGRPALAAEECERILALRPDHERARQELKELGG